MDLLSTTNTLRPSVDVEPQFSTCDRRTRRQRAPGPGPPGSIARYRHLLGVGSNFVSPGITPFSSKIRFRLSSQKNWTP